MHGESIFPHGWKAFNLLVQRKSRNRSVTFNLHIPLLFSFRIDNFGAFIGKSAPPYWIPGSLLKHPQSSTPRQWIWINSDVPKGEHLWILRMPLPLPLDSLLGVSERSLPCPPVQPWNDRRRVCFSPKSAMPHWCIIDLEKKGQKRKLWHNQNSVWWLRVGSLVWTDFMKDNTEEKLALVRMV